MKAAIIRGCLLVALVTAHPLRVEAVSGGDFVDGPSLSPIMFQPVPTTPKPSPCPPLRIAEYEGPPKAAAKPDIDDIETDRPDFTESSKTVPPGMAQFENGWTFENASDDTRTHTAPETLLRLGLWNTTEFRYGVPNAVRIRGTQRVSGLGDMYVGLKQEVPFHPAGVDLALIPAMTVPTGRDGITSHRLDPQISVTWARDLSPRWELSGMGSFFWLTQDFPNALGGVTRRHNRTVQNTVSLSRAWTRRWSTFFEHLYRQPRHGTGEHVFHTGIIFGLTPNQQFDVHGGVGLSRAAPDWFIAAGYSFRIGAFW